MKKTVVSWSGGKDSAYALHKVKKDNQLQVEELLTTLSEKYKRSNIHGIRKELIERQSEEAGVPLRKVWLPEDCSNQDYGEIMSEVMKEYKEQGIEIVTFADIFLQEVRKYREENLSSTNLQGYWPLWGLDTSKLFNDFLEKGFKATTVCVEAEKLDKSFAGTDLDQKFLEELPDDVDPCGENGEYHTFVRDGPVFENPIQMEKGEVIEREIKGSLFYYSQIFHHCKMAENTEIQYIWLWLERHNHNILSPKVVRGYYDKQTNKNPL